MATRAVMVTWIDATRGDDFAPPATAAGIERRTLGWLLRDDDEGVVLAMSDDGPAGFERWYAIPRAYIVSVDRARWKIARKDYLQTTAAAPIMKATDHPGPTRS